MPSKDTMITENGWRASEYFGWTIIEDFTDKLMESQETVLDSKSEVYSLKNAVSNRLDYDQQRHSQMTRVHSFVSSKNSHKTYY